MPLVINNTYSKQVFKNPSHCKIMNSLLLVKLNLFNKQYMKNYLLMHNTNVTKIYYINISSHWLLATIIHSIYNCSLHKTI